MRGSAVSSGRWALGGMYGSGRRATCRSVGMKATLPLLTPRYGHDQVGAPLQSAPPPVSQLPAVARRTGRNAVVVGRLTARAADVVGAFGGAGRLRTVAVGNAGRIA